MPELPEVELVRLGLTATIVGRCVEAIDVLSPGSLTAPPARLAREVVAHWVRGVARRGKVLILDLDGAAYLLVYPMMT